MRNWSKLLLEEYRVDSINDFQKVRRGIVFIGKMGTLQHLNLL